MLTLPNYSTILTSSEMTSPACNYSQGEIAFQEISSEVFLNVPNYHANVFSEVTDAELILIRERLRVFQRIFYEGQEVSVEQLFMEKLENPDMEKVGFVLNRVFVIIEGDSKVLCIQPYKPSFGFFNRMNFSQNPEVYDFNTQVDIGELINFLEDELQNPNDFVFVLNDSLQFTFQRLVSINFIEIYTDLVTRSGRIDAVLDGDRIGNLNFTVIKVRDEYTVNIYLGFSSN